MPTADINIWAVLVASLFSMVIGFAWYSTSLFGKPWMKEVGLKPKDIKSGPGVGYVITMIASVVQTLVLAHIISYAQADTIFAGIGVAFWAWAGFIAYAIGVNYIFAKRSFRLWKIDAGYFLVLLLLQGALLAVWR